MRWFAKWSFMVCFGVALAQSTPVTQSNEPTAGGGTIQFTSGSYKAMEKSGSASIIVVREGSGAGQVSVVLKTEAETAIAGKDFEPVEKTLVFADGDMEPKMIAIPLIRDGRLETTETFIVTLQNPTGGASLGSPDHAEIKVFSPLFTNDGIVIGLLCGILALVFMTAHSAKPGFKKFYKYVPALLLCYFLPSILGTLNIISGDVSNLYFVSSRYLLPACLVMLCLSIDLKGILRLGPKALIMFFTGTFGIVIGGPLALIIVATISPGTIDGEGMDATWRGMTTVAGSWIGGGANQTAMKEIFSVGDRVFSAMIAVDVIIANLWMAVILYMAGESDIIDEKLKADNSAIKSLQNKMARYQADIAKIPVLADTMKIVGIGFLVTGAAHFGADLIAPWIQENAPGLEKLSLTSKFFWLIVIVTVAGIGLSFTKARQLEGVGASRVGSAFLYVLIASIGMKMDLMAIFRMPGLFLIGAIWISIHAILLIVVAKLIRAPIFFLAVGSQANVGGAASAPVVASAFHPTLAPVGVLLAVLGYAVGTFAAWGCGLLMQWTSGAL